jgi:formiminotetrahydrofolate cyclodeaminase
VSAVATVDLAGLRVGELLDVLEQPQPMPASGAAAALVGAAAASVVVMVARASSEWTDARGVSAQARRLRSRLVPLATADAEAFAAAVEALNDPGADRQEVRDWLLGIALERAAELPLAIAEASADVAVLAALATAEAEPRCRPDAVVAAVLAEGATAAAAGLVDRNLATTRGDARSLRAAAAAQAARAARAAAAESG